MQMPKNPSPNPKLLGLPPYDPEETHFTLLLPIEGDGKAEPRGLSRPLWNFRVRGVTVT